MDINSYLINGFTHTYDKEIANLIGELPPLNEWKTESCGVNYPENIDLNPAMDYIAEKYVKAFFTNYEKGYKRIWNKPENKSMEWHNDLIEGYNLFFLYYLNDVYKDGEICFRVNGKETNKIQPRRHLLVMGSQASNVEHKVNYTSEDRMVVNFGFNY